MDSGEINNYRGKEVIVFTKDNHHYQGQLVGFKNKPDSQEFSHLFILLPNTTYIDVPFGDITGIEPGRFEM